MLSTTRIVPENAGSVNAAAELPADFFDIRADAVRQLEEAARAVQLAAGLLRDAAPIAVRCRCELALELELRQLRELRNQVAEAFRAAALEAEIIAAQVDDKNHYHRPETTSFEDDLPAPGRRCAGCGYGGEFASLRGVLYCPVCGDAAGAPARA